MEKFSLGEKRAKKIFPPLYVSWIYRIFFFFYFVVSTTIARSDREKIANFSFFFLYFSSLYVSPAQAERDLDRMFIVRGFVEVLQRFHALVLRATRRVAMVQHRLEKHLALWIVSGTREEGEQDYASIFGLISRSIRD